MTDHRFDHRLSVERFAARHGKWLRSLGLIDRPWLILGAAPDPILPAALLRGHARVDINNAGKTAAMLGLDRADLTFRATKKSWTEHDKLDTRGLLWLRQDPSRFMRFHLWNRPHLHVGSIDVLTMRDRDEIVRRVSGVSPNEVGDLGKVTNGIAAACYGLFFGVPEIVLAGISLSRTGHSYDGLGRQRLQIAEDALVLEALGKDRRLATTEPELADATGIRSWPSG